MSADDSPPPLMCFRWVSSRRSASKASMVFICPVFMIKMGLRPYWDFALWASTCQILPCTALLFGHVARAMLPHRALFKTNFGGVRTKSNFPIGSKAPAEASFPGRPVKKRCNLGLYSHVAFHRSEYTRLIGRGGGKVTSTVKFGYI